MPNTFFLCTQIEVLFFTNNITVINNYLRKKTMLLWSTYDSVLLSRSFTSSTRWKISAIWNFSLIAQIHHGWRRKCHLFSLFNVVYILTILLDFVHISRQFPSLQSLGCCRVFWCEGQDMPEFCVWRDKHHQGIFG